MLPASRYRKKKTLLVGIKRLKVFRVRAITSVLADKRGSIVIFMPIFKFDSRDRFCGIFRLLISSRCFLLIFLLGVFRFIFWCFLTEPMCLLVKLEEKKHFKPQPQFLICNNHFGLWYSIKCATILINCEFTYSLKTFYYEAHLWDAHVARRSQFYMSPARKFLNSSKPAAGWYSGTLHDFSPQ